MARKCVEENERIKRRYLQYLREAKRSDTATVDKAADAILRFERSTGFKPFKRFHIDQAVKFKAELSKVKSEKTGKQLSKATIDGTLRAVKAFVLWLAGQEGYKSRISYSDAEYFNLNAKDVRIAHAERDTPFPTMEQCSHAFAQMPSATPLQRRDKALFAFLMITAARDGAVASLRLKHIDLVQGCVYQDARDVKTKAAKTFTTFFLPVDPVYRETFVDWVTFLRQELLFGNDDALFPKQDIGHVNRSFAVTGFARQPYASASAIREAIKAAFVAAGLPAFGPHSFRKTLVKWGDGYFMSREAFKAFSQNIGHDSEITTVGSYLKVSQERQAELMRGRPTG
jgi:integrase/recombinase XerD